MGKALLGTHATPSSLRLLDEVRALRQRVADLERALAAAEAVRDDRRDTHADTLVVDGDLVGASDREPATT
jgi:N12 class adenine-specific DNA methylase